MKRTIEAQAVFLEDNFYTALLAYLNRSRPIEGQPPHHMQPVPDDLSAEGWLSEAKDIAYTLQDRYQIDKLGEFNTVVEWVNDDAFEQADDYLTKQKMAVKSLIARMQG